MTLSEQLDQFNAFANRLAEQMGNELSIDEVYDKWWSDHRQSADLAAIREAHAEYQEGKRGRPAKEVLADLRSNRNVDSEH